MHILGRHLKVIDTSSALRSTYSHHPKAGKTRDVIGFEAPPKEGVATQARFHKSFTIWALGTHSPIPNPTRHSNPSFNSSPTGTADRVRDSAAK
ncbi:GM19811 [Drosophila sechellia]|uniref:GM19811 n=1 Tax=Drosophila sechellia TaxID=7238 RepID=B4HPT0_DROSE|nr:GM19811 [Drosophila sechellia]